MFPLLLLAFLNAFGGLASSYTPATINLDSRDYDYLQEDQNRQGFIFQEIQVNSPLQDTVKNNLGSGGLMEISIISAPYFAVINAASSGYLQDKRSAITNQIFPFHFFW